MIKDLWLFIALIACTFTSCSQDLQCETEDPAAIEIVAGFEILHPDFGATKAVKKGWEAGDVVYLFFEDVTTNSKHIKMQYDGHSWTTILKGGLKFTDLSYGGKKLTAVFLPFAGGAEPRYNSGWSFGDIFYSYYLVAEKVPYTISVVGAKAVLTVSGDALRMSIPNGYVQFFINDAAASNGKADLRESHVVPVAISGITSKGVVSETERDKGASMPGYVYNGGYLFSGVLDSEVRGKATDYMFYYNCGSESKYAAANSKVLYTGSSSARAVNISNLSWQDCVSVVGVSINETELVLKPGELSVLVPTIIPSNATNQKLNWKSDATSIATVQEQGKYGIVTAIAAGNAIISVTTEDGGFSASCSVTVSLTASGAQNGHEWVDLGLPSGLKWATCNVGASTPEAYGDYFAWGETTTKNEYTWQSYTLCMGDNKSMTKYCKSYDYGTVMDKKNRLDDIDDAAHMNWGGSWRMPTDTESQELKDGCTWTSVTQNGVKGYLGQSRYNNNSIFFPAAGKITGSTVSSAGSTTGVWSALLYDGESSYAQGFSPNYGMGSGTARYQGYPVRPVCDGSKIVAVNGVQISQEFLILQLGESQRLSAEVIPSNATNKTLLWSTASKTIATVTYDGVVRAMEPGTTVVTVKSAEGAFTAICIVTVENSGRRINGHEWVDLGLPSGIKWATCNVGALAPEEYGDYFAWGETAPKYEYSANTYRWMTGGWGAWKYTKYCLYSKYGTVDGRSVLELSDDAANANWGSSWRMPTYYDAVELANNCYWETKEQNGVAGCLITSKLNGKSIFIPASGYQDYTNAPRFLTRGSSGCCWTSKHSGGGTDSHAYSIQTNSSGKVTSGKRTDGFCVRPVSP